MKIKARMNELKSVYATYVESCINAGLIPSNTSSTNLNDYEELVLSTREYLDGIVVPLVVEHNVLHNLCEEIYNAYCNGHSDGRTGGTVITELKDWASSDTRKGIYNDEI